jgi:hypothetical protein
MMRIMMPGDPIYKYYTIELLRSSPENESSHHAIEILEILAIITSKQNLNYVWMEYVYKLFEQVVVGSGTIR